MTFARPHWLWLLAAVPFCLGWALVAAKRRRAVAAAYPTLAASPVRRAVKSLLFLAGLAALGLAAAGPRLGATTPPAGAAVSESAPLTVIVALDCSRSMRARDLAPDRLGAAKGLVLDVLARLPRVRAGLVGFAGRAWLACPVTADRSSLALFLDALSPGDAPLGGTNMRAALEAASLALAGARPGAVLLVSDGEETLAERDAPPLPAGLPVFTVAVGSALPVPVPDTDGTPLRDREGKPVAAGVDAAGLAELARASGATAFRLSPDAPIPAEPLAQALLTLARTDASGEQPLPGDEESTPLLALGVALLLADALLAPAGRRIALTLFCLLLAAHPVQAASSAREKTRDGLAAFAKKDHQAALDAFLAARARDPDAPAILYDIGTAYYRLSRFEAARAAFERAATMAAPPLAAKARYNQGNAAYRLGDVPGAVAGYEAALALDPQDADARANLDWLRDHPAPPPPPSGEGDNTRQPGPSPDGQQAGTQPQSGQAQAQQDGDDGSGKEHPDALPQPGQAGTDDPAQEATVPVPGREGEKGGPRRAGSPGAADDATLDRIPDLPGLPATPVYGRPSVEKDW